MSVRCWAFVFLFLAACSRPKVRDGWVHYPEAGLEIPLEESWKATKVKGIPLPVIHTEEDHGIQPNLFPVEFSPAPPEEAMRTFMVKESEQDAELEVIGQTAIRVETRTVRKGLPLLRIYYALPGGNGTLIVAATCAEATSASYKRAFDRMAERARALAP